MLRVLVDWPAAKWLFTGVTKHDLIGERKIAARVGLAAEWIETWPLTDLYTVHVNERLSQIGAGHLSGSQLCPAGH